MGAVRGGVHAALLAAVVGGCEPSKGTPAPVDAADDGRTKDVPPPTDALGPGCRRSGPVAGVESDETCVVPSAEAADTVGAMRSVALTLTPDAPETLGGGQINLRLAITNTGKRSIAIVLEAEPPGAGPHYDWSLLTGLSPPRSGPAEGFRARFGMKTLDARGVSVDQLRLVPPGSPAPLRLYRVVLAPEATLSHSFVWLALGIPAPYPPFEDDAGHRVVPKTAPKPLPPGKYSVVVDVPLQGVASSQRAVTAQVAVVRANAD